MWTKSALYCSALLLVSACGSRPTNALATNGSYQDIREQVIRAFTNSPATALEQYRAVFGLPNGSDGKTLVMKIVVCGQLHAKQLPPDPSCQNVIHSGLAESNAEIRGIAASALAFFDDDESLSQLIGGLSDPADVVRIEAAQSLEYKFDTLAADPNQPNAVDPLRKRLEPYCSHANSAWTSASRALCDKVEQRP